MTLQFSWKIQNQKNTQVLHLASMFWLRMLVLCLLCIYEHQVSCEDITLYRTQCRRDTMFKKSDENRVLSGTSNVIQRAVASLVYCVRGCLKIVRCLSINYKRPSIGNKTNCELLDINKSNSSAIVLDKPAWNIYEPVIQVFLFSNDYLRSRRDTELLMSNYGIFGMCGRSLVAIARSTDRESDTICFLSIPFFIYRITSENSRLDKCHFEKQVCLWQRGLVMKSSFPMNSK